MPRLSGCMAYFACEVTRQIDVSDHGARAAEVAQFERSHPKRLDLQALKKVAR
ncbi:flavin reductase family protein [Bradyrhizobium sp. Ghvi]|uniref:flavin reductase family protein n=1 Tax=Bradyrhizobium sp. Ghvi TaxID=1855319 RepID=UPI0015A662CA